MSRKQTCFDNTPVKATWQIPQAEMPASARVVIVGGGIAGASLAYHFAKAGWQDVVLLEQNQIASGTTWHSAGQVGQLRSSSAQTKVNKASAELYASLADETGHDPGWLQCGGLQLASCEERMHQLHRNASMADFFGVQAEIIGKEKCREFWPMLNTEDLIGGVYLPGDGRVLPGECTVALTKGAQQMGARIVENVTVQQLTEERAAGLRRITGVKTNIGNVAAEWVVLAGNMWMRQLGMTTDIDIPVYPCEHHYLVTRPIEGVTRHSPCTRDPDAGIYFRALDDGGLKLGAFKKRSKPWEIGDTVPGDFAFKLLEPDWPDFEEPLRDHMHRLKGVSREDIVKFVNGPEAFTPDNNFIMGQPHSTEGLFVMGGWNSAGIACAGGAGMYAVEWIENGGMTIDLASVDILRFLPFQNKRGYLKERVSEVLGLHYQMAWPGRQKETAREIRASELYKIHKANNACFGETAGWERPLFFAPKGVDPQIEYSFARQNWHDCVCEDVNACRNNVAILDQSTFAKFQLSGPKSLDILQRLCGANIDVTINKAVYTGMFNRRGTFESDLTVVRQSAEKFYIVTGTAQQQKDFDWIMRHVEGQDVTLVDVTESRNVVSVMGPRSDEVLSQLASGVVNATAAYGQVRTFNFANQEILALRISYVGEAGWELHVPTECATALYRAIEAAGSEFSIRPIGNLAISAMRIESGFRAMGHELSSVETPLEAGLGWAIDWKKEFLGKEAILTQKEKGIEKRLVCLALNDPQITLWGSEPIYWDGKVVGYTSSACFGPSVGASVGMGYVRNPNGSRFKKQDFEHATIEIGHRGKRIECRSSLKPIFKKMKPKI